jgi:hypothetical protein
VRKFSTRLAAAALVLMLLLKVPLPSWADLAATPGVGALIAYKLIGGANYVETLLCDSVVGVTQCAAVTAANAIKVDSSAVTQPVSQPTAANLNTTSRIQDSTGAALGSTGGSLNVAVQSGNISVTSSSLPAGASTSALQGTNTATTAHTCSVAGFSELGCLGQIDDDVKGPIPAGTNQIGFVGLQSNTTGGCTPGHYLSLATINSTNIKPSAGTLCFLEIIQNTTTAADLRLYDSATAPTCSSATGVVMNQGVQSNAVSPGSAPTLGPFGMNFANGISFCLTAYDGTDTNNVAATTGLQINYAFK